MCLLCWSLVKFPKFSLDIVKELLDGVQPRRVLGIQKYVCFEVPCSSVHRLVLVNGGVIHQDDDLLVLRFSVDSELV